MHTPFQQAIRQPRPAEPAPANPCCDSPFPGMHRIGCSNHRIDRAATNCYNVVFESLDGLMDLTGDDADRIAAEVEELVRQRLAALWKKE